ncbi:MAG: cytochrome c oxidase assembly protein [Alphaproteobacteria bacterium]|nr:cytochrome c oxidase assembly protein [Alphaproteobacteria bacterium]
MRSGVGNLRTLVVLGVFVAGMGGLAYASVPLYEIFCRVTGYGGTTQVAAIESNQVIDRVMKIRFDSNVNPALDWAFDPVLKSMELKVGENALAFYQAENQSDETIVGTATFNVTPDKAGLFFNKVDCFCFTEQVLKPGQKVDMPVTFFIDPSIVEDPNLDDVTTITLSYTFFRSQDQSATKRIVQARSETGGGADAITVDLRAN